MIRKALLAAILALAALAGAAFADEQPVLLKARFFKNQTYVVSQTYGYALDVTGENDLDFPIGRMEDEIVERYQESIVELDGDAPRKVRRAYDAAAETVKDSAEGEMTFVLPQKGRTLILEKKGARVEAKDSVGNDLSDLAESIGMFYDYRRFLPGGPVSPGDKWTVKSEAADGRQQGAPWIHAAGDIEASFEKIEPCRNSKCAALSVRMKLAYPVSEGSGVSVQLKGTMKFAIAEGYPVSMDFRGPAEFHDDPEGKHPLTRRAFAKGEFYYRLEEKL